MGVVTTIQRRNHSHSGGFWETLDSTVGMAESSTMGYPINTEQNFLDREIAVWGEDYVFDLLDKGYKIVQRDDGKFGWVFDSELATTQERNRRNL